MLSLFPARRLTPPGNWTSAVVSPAVYDGSYWYVGNVSFSAGTPIQIGDELDFHYKISFAGHSSTNYLQELSPIPEPGTLVLLAGLVGMFALGYLRRK
jgi:hypothetical protein